MNDVSDALDVCGINADNNNMIFNGVTAAQRIANEVFDDSYESFMDITFAELDDCWKTYAQLTLAEGRLRLRPATKSNICTLTQWIRDQLCTNVNPAFLNFLVAQKQTLIIKFHTHKQWLDNSSGMLKTAMPKQFKDDIKWEDWKTTFVNFLRTQPGRNGVPLSYVIRDSPAAIIQTNANFLDDYIDRAPIIGNAFNIDKVKVHALLIRLISENPVAEQKVLPIKDQSDGRLAFTTLKDFYKGVGINSKSVLNAERNLSSLFYLGEKKPHMWWDEFEACLVNAFVTFDKDATRQVHTNDMKLRLLNTKIRADFLSNMKANIQMEMNKVPRTMTFQNALTNYRNMVNKKFPQDQSAHMKKRRIQSTRSNQGGRGSGGRSSGGVVTLVVVEEAVTVGMQMAQMVVISRLHKGMMNGKLSGRMASKLRYTPHISLIGRSGLTSLTK